MGPSGAGKSSQAELLAANNPSYTAIGLGQALRQSHDPQVQAILKAGDLVDDRLAAQIIEDAIKEVPAGQTIVLDGFPRRLSQVPFLEQILSKLNLKLNSVIVLDVERDTVVERLGRRGRADDTTETIDKKWQVFQGQTQGVIDHFRKLGLVKIVDGAGTVADVNKRVVEAMESES